MKRAVKKIAKILRVEAYVPRMVKVVSKDFSSNQSEVPRRNYTSYEQYLRHQIEKADVYEMEIRAHDSEYENIIHGRFANYGFQGKSILCLGARFGGEVRAFTELGALAIGLDLNPGKNNLYVLPGDVHKLQFADKSFDIIYTNILDHIYDVETFFSEIKRVLKNDGVAYFEVNLSKPTRYESIDISDLDTTIGMLSKRFILVSRNNVHNKTSYVDWSGELIECKV